MSSVPPPALLSVRGALMAIVWFQVPAIWIPPMPLVATVAPSVVGGKLVGTLKTPTWSACGGPSTQLAELLQLPSTATARHVGGKFQFRLLPLLTEPAPGWPRVPTDASESSTETSFIVCVAPVKSTRHRVPRVS